MAELDIPAPSIGPSIGPSYRVARPRQALDLGTKRLLIAAGGVMGALLLLAGGWTAVRRHNAPIPVIEADARPIRVKPDHPGGLQVAGADEQVMGDGSTQARALAPVAEAPAPQALRAQSASVQSAPIQSAPIQSAPAQVTQVQSAQPAPPPTVQAAQPAPAPQVAAPPPAAAPQAPTPAPRVAVPAVPARPATPTAAMQVQLAAVESEQAATAEWQRLAKRMPELLNSRHPAVQRAEVEGRTIWRLRVGGFADMADATSFCGKVRAKGGGCSFASF